MHEPVAARDSLEPVKNKKAQGVQQTRQNSSISFHKVLWLTRDSFSLLLPFL